MPPVQSIGYAAAYPACPLNPPLIVLILSYSIGGCSPRCERCSKSSFIPGQHTARHRWYLLCEIRQRRQQRHKPREWTMCSYEFGDEPVVGGRPASGTVRGRRQIHQQRRLRTLWYGCRPAIANGRYSHCVTD